MDNIQESTPCPVCGQTDRVRSVSEIPEADELAPLTMPPDAPDAPPPLVGMNEGLGCVGALFFGSAFFLSVAFGSLVASIIFGMFILFFILAFVMLLRKQRSARRKQEVQISAWQEKMETWERLLVCSRDRVVYDPQSRQHVPVERIQDLYP
jgi:hypothetical protein